MNLKNLKAGYQKVIKDYIGNGERELTKTKDCFLSTSSFYDPGESPLKECEHLFIYNCKFHAKYALWEDKDIIVYKSHFYKTDRAPLWYTKSFVLDYCQMFSPKTLRECTDFTIRNTTLKGIESLWKSDKFTIDNFIFESYYPFFECSNGTISHLKMKGKYSFQYCHNLTITNSELDTKDAFWHCKDITVIDSIIKGEYTGWFASSLHFKNCTFMGTQPFVSSSNITFENCSFREDCDRAFEYTTASGSLNKLPISIYNPKDIDFVSDDRSEIIVDKDYSAKYKISNSLPNRK